MGCRLAGVGDGFFAVEGCVGDCWRRRGFCGERTDDERTDWLDLTC